MPTNTALSSQVVRAGRLRLLRTLHTWSGLWVSGFVLVFGITGLVLNHRYTLKLPIEKTVSHTLNIAVPPTSRNSPETMTAWLQDRFSFTPAERPRHKTFPAEQVDWDGVKLEQPPRWNIQLRAPTRSIEADYFVAATHVRITLTNATPIGIFTRLHMAIGADAYWVLLSDSIAAGLVMLSLTGLLLWSKLLRPRWTGVFVASAGPALALLWLLSLQS